jgi:uncharacterized coiled-coil DUF342 family protein
MADCQSKADALRQAADYASSSAADSKAKIDALQKELESARSEEAARSKEVNV